MKTQKIKILVDPDWISLVRDLSTEQKAELLTCILSYPNGNSTLGSWEFMKLQIDREVEKYQNKCGNLSNNRQKRWPNKQTYDKNETEESQKSSISVSNSKSIESKNNIYKEKSIDNSKEIKSLLKGLAKSHRMDGPLLYEINHEFDFEMIAERDSRFKEAFYNGDYSDQSLTKAQQSLINKRYGQKLTISQIQDWVDQEGKFKK